LIGQHLDAQPLSSSSSYVDGLELSPLYTLQHGLTGDAETAHSVDDRYIAFRLVLDEARAQLLGDSDAPRCARRQQLTNRSRMRRRLPSAPSREVAGVEAEAPCELDLHASGRVGGKGRGQRASFSRRRRMPWAQLLRRLLHVDALSCPRCSTAAKSIPMVVLAFLTDADVVGRILRHLGWPWVAPVLAPARFSCEPLEFGLSEAGGGGGEGSEEGGGSAVCELPARSPPRRKKRG